MATTVIMRGGFLGKQRIEDSLAILGYPKASWRNIINLINDKVDAELPDGAAWSPYTSELIGEHGKTYGITEEDIKDLIEAKSMEVRDGTEDLQGLKMTIYGKRIDDEHMGIIATYMDDETRERVNDRFDGNSHEEYLEAYLKEDPDLLPILINEFEFEWEKEG